MFSGCGFTFNNINSSTYGLIIANVDTTPLSSIGGNLEKVFLSNRLDPRQRIVNNYYEERLSFEIEFVKLNGVISNTDFNNICLWLNNEMQYGVLKFDSTDYDGYKMNCYFTNGDKIIANGGIKGLKFTCNMDSGFMWSDKQYSNNLAYGILPTGTIVVNGSTVTNGLKQVGSTFCNIGDGTGTNNANEVKYVQLDLGEVKSIYESRVYFYGYATSQFYYKIKYSNDGVVWNYAVGTSALNGWVLSTQPTTVLIGTINPTINDINISARYIRLYCNGSTVGLTSLLYEWELYTSDMSTTSISCANTSHQKTYIYPTTIIEANSVGGTLTLTNSAEPTRVSTILTAQPYEIFTITNNPYNITSNQRSNVYNLFNKNFPRLAKGTNTFTKSSNIQTVQFRYDVARSI
jgi:phage-related protein